MLSRKEKDKHRMVILTCETLKKNTGLIKQRREQWLLKAGGRNSRGERNPGSGLPK